MAAKDKRYKNACYKLTETITSSNFEEVKQILKEMNLTKVSKKNRNTLAGLITRRNKWKSLKS